MWENCISVDRCEIFAKKAINWESDVYLHREIAPNEWTHVVFVWNRGTRTGTLYLNGSHAGELKSTYNGPDIDLNSANHSTYELGLQKGTKNLLHGYLRDLAVFLRPLTPEEVFNLFSKFPSLIIGLNFSIK